MKVFYIPPTSANDSNPAYLLMRILIPGVSFQTIEWLYTPGGDVGLALYSR